MSTATDLAPSFVLSPAGNLRLEPDDGRDAGAPPERIAAAAQKAFERGNGHGLLYLATGALGEELPPVWRFWRRFAERYLSELCHSPDIIIGVKEAPPLPVGDFPALAGSAPPMRGAEYLTAQTLAGLWVAMDTAVRVEAKAYPGGLSDWLEDRSPLWRRVGRVCFHLAENKRDPDFPFAFLATYAPRLIDGKRVQYQPLGHALTEYAGARNRKTLMNLLGPVHAASEKCPWVRDLADSGEVFHPLRWRKDEAYKLLKDIPALEASGLLVRVPDWWTKRPTRVQVNVTIGEKPLSSFGANAMLNFDVSATLDGETLTPEEWEQIQSDADGLVLLKGRWVEVSRERLSKALEHWKRVEKEAGGDGVTFIKAMRLLAGAPVDNSEAVLLDSDYAAWTEVRAGQWLEGRLKAWRVHGGERDLPERNALKATLRPYQEDGVRWLRLLSDLGLGACLADDMGLGKTIQVIALLLLLKGSGEKKEGRASLLVLPASLLANWKSEIERFAPSLKVRFAHPALAEPKALRHAARRPEEFVGQADVVLTTYGMLARQEWLAKVSWRLAILDEAQAIKNPGAKQTRAVKQLKAAARIVLTGTPVENRLGDLWSLFDFACPGLLGSPKQFGDFVKRLEARTEDQYGPLRRLIGPYILRRLKTDKNVIRDLPNKTEVTAFCGLSRKQAVLYQKAVQELDMTLKTVSGIERRGVVLAFLMRFKQICNHPVQWLGNGDYEPEDSGKFRRLRELCEEIGARQEKALVFTQFREMTGPLSGFLREVFGKPGLVLHGQTQVGKRKSLVDDFQREDGPPFFVLSLKAGGTGLNLTAASHVLHFDRWWNPAVENQATDRAFRIGQKRNVMVHKFVCQGTVEERIDELIREKTSLAQEVLEGGAPRLLTEMSDRELLDFVRLDMNRVSEE